MKGAALDARCPRYNIASIVASSPLRTGALGAGKGDVMQVGEGMSPTVLTVGPEFPFWEDPTLWNVLELVPAPGN